MSNSIAPGSSADVNVKVTALTTNPNVPVTYKTVILKKNLVNGVNTLTQEMMSAQNTKYVIKYDYVLGENVIVPENCILEFEGGSISGEHTITGSSTNIIANTKVFDENVVISIDNFNGIAHTKWFGYKTSSINKACASFGKCSVVIDSGVYVHDETVVVPYDISIISEMATINATIPLPVLDIYMGDNPVNLSALRIILSGNFTGSVVRLYGRRYNNIKGYSYAFRLQGTNGLTINLPYVYGERTWFANIPESIGYEIITEDNTSTDPDLYHYIYYNEFIGTCENIKTGCYINNADGTGVITTNRYKFTLWYFVNAVRTNKPLAVDNVFFLYAQLGPMSRKYLLVDNLDNEGVAFSFAGDQGPTLNIELMDIYQLSDEIKSQMIDNLPRQSVNIINSKGDDIILPGTLYKNKYFPQTNIYYGSIYDKLNENEHDLAPVFVCDENVIGYIWKEHFVGDKTESATNPATTIHTNFIKSILLYLNKQSLTRSAIINICINRIVSCMSIEPDIREAFTYILPKKFGSTSAYAGSYILDIYFNIPRQSKDRNIIEVELYCQESYTRKRIFERFTATYNDSELYSFDLSSLWCDGFYGNSNSRPNIGRYGEVTNYFDTDLSKPINYVPTLNKWIEVDGATAGVNRSGTFSNKPSASDIYVGFRYFCTDKQTTEGATDGIEIIHKGNDIWVDALGRVVS